MTKSKPINRHEVLNQIINFFWTILCVAPVFWFWAKEGVNTYFYSFLGISFLVGILPERLLKMFMLGKTKGFYEKLGVKHIRKFVQNGSIVKMIDNKQDSFVINGKSQARLYLKTIAMYERYHWICLLFFMLTAFYCFFCRHFKFGVLITAANIVYNLCPVLLQQYNKVRIRAISNSKRSL